MNGVTHEPVVIQNIDAGLTWKIVYHNSEVAGQGQELLDIRFKNEKEGFAISNLFDNVFTTDGGLIWSRTYDNEAFELPQFNGTYSSIDGFAELYISGCNGYLVKWK